MAGRLNTRFVMILAIVVVVVGGGLGLIFLAAYKSTDERIALGDQYVAEGNYERASKEYGKLLHKVDSQSELVPVLVKFFDATGQVKVPAGPEANAAFQQILGAINQATLEDPGNLTVFQRYMAILTEVNAWDRMYDRANTSVKASPGMIEARKFRGVAQVNRLRGGLSLLDEDRQLMKDDLEIYLKQNPDDPESVLRLAQAHLVEADIQSHRPNVRSERLEQIRQIAIDLTAQALAGDPEAIRRQLDHAVILTMAHRYTEAMPIVAGIEKKMLERPGSRREVLILIGLIAVPEEEIEDLTQEQTKAVRDRRINILRVALEANPEDLVIKGNYGFALLANTEFEKAKQVFREMRDVEVLATPVEAYLQTSAQQMGIVRLCDLMLNAAELETDVALRDESLETVEDMLEQAVDIPETHAYYNLLRGKLFSLRKQWVDAIQSLTKADEQLKSENAEVLLRLARALEQAGEGGRAREKLLILLELEAVSDYLPARYALVRISTKLKQYDDAHREIKRILADHPNDTIARKLKVELLRAEGKADEAIAMLKDWDPKDHPTARLDTARVLIGDDRKEEAKRLLEEEFAKTPTDETVVQLLLLASADKDEAYAYLKQAKAAGLEGDWVDKVEHRISTDMSVVEFVEAQISEIEDPFRQHLGRYRLYKQTGEAEKAAVEFAKAKQLQPDDPLVIDMAFGQALSESRWSDAQILASRAGTLNLDRAQGAFFMGRLDVARGQFDRAVSSFREGLHLRPDFSLGWQMLAGAQRRAFDFKGSVESYQKALELRPDNLKALLGLANVHATREEHEPALENLRKAHQYIPKDSQVRSSYLDYLQQYGDKQEAIKLRQELAVSEPDDAENRRQLALLLAETGDQGSALESIEGLIEQEGVTLNNIAAKAQLLAESGDEDKAHEVFKAYIVDLGDDVRWQDWLALARLQSRLKMGKDAMQSYQHAVKIEDEQTKPASRELAVRLFRGGQFAQAETLLKNLFEAIPDDQSIGQSYVETLLRGNKLEDAQRTLRSLIDRHGANEMTYLLEAQVASAEGRQQDVFEALEQAEEINSQQPLIHIHRAELFARNRRIGEARAAVAKALQLAPNNMRARLLLTQLLAQTGEFEEAITELLALLKRDEKMAEARMQLAILYIQTDQLIQARRILDESAEMYPKDARWPHKLSQLDQHERRWTDSAARLKQAFEMTQTVDLLSELCMAQIRAKRPEEVIETLGENPEFVQTHPLLNAVRGWALADLDRTEEAKAAYRKAIDASTSLLQMRLVARHISAGIGYRAKDLLEEAMTEDNDVIVTLVLAEYDLEDHDFESTARRLKLIDDKVPFDSPQRKKWDDMLSIALHQIGDYEGARIAYERLIQQNPNDLQSLNNLAYMLSENLGRPDEAMQYVEKANELMPNNAQILDTLGWVQFLAGQREDALRTLRASTEEMRMPSNSLHLARVLLDRNQLEDRGEAEDWLQRSRLLAERYQDKATLDEVERLFEQYELSNMQGE